MSQTENKTFEQWAEDYDLDNEFPTRIGMAVDCKAAWDAAIEACAKIADSRAMRCEEKTALAESADEVTELRSLAWQFSMLADEMRKCSK